MRHFDPARPSPTARWVLPLILVPLVLVLVGVGLLLLAPRRLAYTLSADALLVEAALGPVDMGRSVPRASIQAARQVTLSGARRVAGTAMPGFCHGRWRFDDIGTVWLAGTCGPEAVLVEVQGEDRPVVINPADPAALLAALQDGGTGRFDPLPTQAPDAEWLLVSLLLLLPVGGTGALVVLSPRRLRFDVGEGALLVRTLWGTRRVPLSGATVRPDPAARPTLRMFGIGMPGHQVGRYRIGGRTAQLYLSNVKHAVWVEPAQGLPVLVSPEDVDGFLAAAKAQGARG